MHGNVYKQLTFESSVVEMAIQKNFDLFLSASLSALEKPIKWVLISSIKIIIKARQLLISLTT